MVRLAVDRARCCCAGNCVLLAPEAAAVCPVSTITVREDMAGMRDQ
ncbi:hypothetical protein IAG44_42400 [Streptomyces roseirectus]|uniref:Ferredoxin n=1 Tax=Streptomyces roseirectus TaxID=2768066 RepID=A0A7H0IRJ0_9ACTN|nr:hypothetical protein [Streptomyces roseirectus]QNP75406.1 hypothetical protein IAG44_42400 [Streptomyces roseirectus]